MKRTRIIVTGVVQGVGFRYYTSSLASQFNITGLVRNLPDGSVEIEVEGSENSIKGFVDEVKVGPRHASVKTVQVDWIAPKGDRQFLIY